MRAMKTRGIENKPGQRARITGKEKTTHPEWMDSIIQTAASVNVNLTIGGRHVTIKDDDWPEARLPANEEAIQSPIKQNWGEGKHFYSDIITKYGNGWRTSPINISIPHLNTNYKHVLRHEQAYLHPLTKEIIEILGRWDNTDNPTLEARIWTRNPNKTLRRNETVYLSEKTPSNGMGCNNTIKYNELFNKDETIRIILSSDRVNQYKTTRKIQDILVQNSPIIRIKKRNIWKQLLPYTHHLQNGQIFTDGSWSDNAQKTDILFNKDHENSTTASAIVIMDRGTEWKNKPIIAITITPNSTQVNKQITKSFTAELIGILGALQISNQYQTAQNISTDCQSATKLLNPKRPADWAHHPQNQLLSAIHRLRRNELKWTPSHPERKKKTQTITQKRNVESH